VTPKIVVLGAGFGGLELSTLLSDAFGDDLDLTLIDRSDYFLFGYSKLDVMFGRQAPAAVRLAYGNISKPGVRFRRESVLGIDPVTRRVRTSEATYEADVLVLALGADYDLDGTPGLREAGNEYYSESGAEALRDVLPSFTRGQAVVGVMGEPFKCPPAPSEAALLLHDYLLTRGVRSACAISLVMPFGTPIPPVPGASQALLAAFAERGIEFVPNRKVEALDPGRKAAVLDDGSEIRFDVFLGIPRHRVPDVIEASGLAENGWVPVNPRDLTTRFPSVYAIGDVTSVGTPKAGVFAESAAQVVAASLIAQFRGEQGPEAYAGAGSCYVEFGGAEVGRVDVNFLSGPSPTGSFLGASEALAREKEQFGSSRRLRWFGL
jgi:sulfide:quinone oxidoreductase